MRNYLLLILILLNGCSLLDLKEGVSFSLPLYVWQDEYVIEDTRLSGQFCEFPAKSCDVIYDQVEYKVINGSFTPAGLLTMAKQTERRQIRYNPDTNLCKDFTIPCSPNFVLSIEEEAYPWGHAMLRAKKAWKRSTGAGVKVAIIDTGISPHQDLPIAQCFNAVTKQTGVCQDGNGHGTHVAGTIAASFGNSIGLAGVSHSVSLMGIKFLQDNGSGSLFDAISAIDYARVNGANIINASWGGGGYSQPLYLAIERAASAGILFVAAAGNEGVNNDTYPHYPSNYNLPNIISVAATDEKNKLAPFSNYGKETVDIAAPGVSIYSTLPNNSYGALSGTSMAAPHVTGAAALYLSRSPQASASQVLNKILSTARKPKKLRGKIKSGGVVNAFNLLKENL